MSTIFSFARTRASVKACVLLVFSTALAAISTGMLRGSMPEVQTGPWTATGNLTGARSGAATASASVARRDHQPFLLPNNNAVLIVGGIAETTVNGVATSETTQSAGGSRRVSENESSVNDGTP